MKRKSVLAGASSPKSELHRSTLATLRRLYPSFTILEEEYVEYAGQRLFVDLIVKNLKVAVECHGEQHFKFNAHHYASKEQFEAQKRRDDLKQEAIRNAGYASVVVRYDEKLTPTQLAKRITKAIQESTQ